MTFLNILDKIEFCGLLQSRKEIVSKMADIKRAKCINAPNIVIFSLILIVLLLGASMIFLLLEDPVLVSTTKKTNPVTTDSTKISLATECNPQSLKIGDKVCDDDTNFEKCLFDGGDCCLETKSTPFCRDCMCKMKGTYCTDIPNLA